MTDANAVRRLARTDADIDAELRDLLAALAD